jgi:hypothetical protein
MRTYTEIKAFATEHNHHVDEIEMELFFGGQSKWFTVAIIYSTDFGEFYIVSAHINCSGVYCYFPFRILDDFYDEIKKAIWGLDELEEEREAQREAYRDQRRTA